jgi:hypothetical protein
VITLNKPVINNYFLTQEGDLPGTDTKKSWLNSSNGNGTKLNGSESPKPSRR